MTGPRSSDTPAILEDQGIRYLHFGSRWMQGAMRISEPVRLEVEYTRAMMLWLLFLPAPRHILQLGLGAGSLAKYCHRHCLPGRVTAVEHSAAVIDLCRSAFALPDDDGRLRILAMDAMAFVGDPENHGTADIIQVDLYTADGSAPALDSPAFYQACADCLTRDGILTVNLLGDSQQMQRSLRHLSPAFEALAWLPVTDDGNLVAIGFRRAPSIDFDSLYETAAAVRAQYPGLESEQWVDSLMAWMRDGAADEA